MIPASANPLLLRSAAGPAAYSVERSIRLNAPDSAYLSRTPASAGNRRTWTLSLWAKRSNLGAAYKMLFSAGSVSNECSLRFTDSPADALQFYQYSGGGFNWQLVTTQVFRDPSAWYHIVAVVDSTQATSSERVKLYVNGAQITTFGTASYPTQNYDSLVNSTTEHGIGRVSASQYFDGYLADIHFIDGQALTPSSFAETNATTGQWVPKAYTGTYGLNGFKLDFSNNANTTTLGYDNEPVANATGGLPILNTSDASGRAASSGTRTDANAANIVLAVPMNGANNGTTFTDQSAAIRGSGSAKSITRNGDTKTLTAQSRYYGSSGYFDGAGDSLMFPAGADFAYGTGDFTIEGWFYQTQSYATTGGSLLWAQTVSGTNYFCIFAGVYSQSLTFVFGSGGGTTITGPSYSLNTWNHFAVVRSGTTLTIYVNGVGVSGTCSFDFSNTTYVPTIGHYTHGDAQQFQGYIQDIRVYKGVAKYTAAFTPPFANDWTANNLQAVTGGPTSVAAASGGLPIYNTTGTNGETKGTGTRTDANASSLVLAVPMDGANNGTTFTDESAAVRGSGSANTVTVNNVTTSTTLSKYYGSSGFFNGGTNTYLSVDFSANASQFNGLRAITVEGWFYPTAFTDRMQLYYLGNYPLNGSATKIQAENSSANSLGLRLNAWNHVATTMDGTTVRTFVNGGLVSSSSQTSFTGNSGLRIYWGWRLDQFATSFSGFMQDARIYNGVAKYTSNFDPPSTTQNTTVARGCDSLVDSPTSYGTDDGLGGSVRGNYATLNPLDTTNQFGSGLGPLSNGNLEMVIPAGVQYTAAGNFVLSGKTYAEFTGSSSYYGVRGATNSNLFAWIGSNFYRNGSNEAVGVSYATADVVGIAYDSSNQQLSFYKNGTLAFQKTIASDNYVHFVSGGNTTIVANFGQRPFAFPVSGFKALCDTSLPTPTIAKGSSAFDVKLYTGNGSTQTISGLGFSPDLVWMKARSIGYNHTLIDSVRGATKTLSSSMTVQEYTEPTGPTAFTSDGWSMSGDVTYVGSVNANGQTYAGWAWDAGTSTVTNTSGTISSQVRANPSAGFSIVTYTGNNTAGATIGHGLNAIPQFIITFKRGGGREHAVWHSGLSSSGTLYLANTYAAATYPNRFDVTGFTSNVFKIGSTTNTVNEVDNYVAYCWAPVAGYSSFGSYTGNGSADGPFVYTGFRPRWILLKRSDSSTGPAYWIMWDSARKTYNLNDTYLLADQSQEEFSNAAVAIDILSNGFKLRNASTNQNANGGTYIYAAFAESPLQYSRAR